MIVVYRPLCKYFCKILLVDQVGLLIPVTINNDQDWSSKNTLKTVLSGTVHYGTGTLKNNQFDFFKKDILCKKGTGTGTVKMREYSLKIEPNFFKKDYLRIAGNISYGMFKEDSHFFNRSKWF